MKTTKGTDIMFVVSPVNAQAVWMPFYFLYLTGYLEKYGYSVEIVNPHKKNIADNVKIIIQEIKAKKPKFIGLPVFATDYNIGVDLAARIKKFSKAKILVGNVQASIAPRDFLYENSPFDIVVRGEGELTLKQLLSEYDDAWDISHIKGIAYFKDGGVKITPNRELMDLSECGMPAYHKIDIAWYCKPSKHVIRRLAAVGAVIYLGRGCPFNCSFCAANTVWRTNEATPENPLVRKRPMANVIAELRILQDTYRFDFFYILDDTFGISEKDIVEFCEAYRGSGLKMLWAATTRVDCIQNKEIVRLLKRSGCIQLDFGVETGSPRLLRSINKAIEVEQTIRAFDLCRKNGIRTFANILLNLPGEKREDLVLTRKLLARIKPVYTQVAVMQAYPGTEVYKKLSKPVPKEDYHKFNRAGLAPKEFDLNAHGINMRKLSFLWRLRCGNYTPFEGSLFRADGKYWTKVFKSKNRWRYVRYLAIDSIKVPLQFVKIVLLFLRGKM